jgi:hypothetical protein
VNYGACQISDMNSFGQMLAKDARAGYTGDYIPQADAEEDDIYGQY